MICLFVTAYVNLQKYCAFSIVFIKNSFLDYAGLRVNWYNSDGTYSTLRERLLEQFGAPCEKEKLPSVSVIH